MEEQTARLVPLRTCSKSEQRFIYLLRALVAGPAWRSQAIHELGALGIDSESSFVLLHLVESLQRLTPPVTILAPRSPVISVDELNVLTLLRRASSKTKGETAADGDLGFSMPDELSEIIPIAGLVLRDSGVRIGTRPMLVDGWNVVLGNSSAATEAITDARALRKTTVISNEILSPTMRRVTFVGNALSGISDSPPAQWVKVFPRSLNQNQPIGRVYTVRQMDTEAHALAIDVAIHGGGAVSSWLQTAQPGDECDIAGARGGYEGVPRDCPSLILAGDETALPAIASILESVPEALEVRALIAISNEKSQISLQHSANTTVQWIIMADPTEAKNNPLSEQVIAHCAFRRDSYIWAAGEAGWMRDLRKNLLTSVQYDARRILTVGYWKRGETDHRDAAAG